MNTPILMPLHVLISQYQGSVVDCIEHVIQENYMLYYYQSSLSNEHFGMKASTVLNRDGIEYFDLMEVLDENTFKKVKNDEGAALFEVSSSELLLRPLHQFSDKLEYCLYETFESQSWFYWDKLPDDEWFIVESLNANGRVYFPQIKLARTVGIEQKVSKSQGMYELPFKAVMIKKSDAQSIINIQTKSSSTKVISEAEKEKLYILISGLCAALSKENERKYISGSKINAAEIHRKLESVLGVNMPYKTEKKLQTILSEVKQLIK